MLSKLEVGDRIRESRFRHSMTLKDVARRAGLSATHISEIERGKASPTIGALQRIADALGERTAHFVEERSEITPNLVPADARLIERTTDSAGRAVETERMTGDVPWSTLQIVRRIAAPGEVAERPGVAAECVYVCLEGMVRLTVGGEPFVLREGDTLQFRMDPGLMLESIGEEPSGGIAFTSFTAPRTW